MGRERTRISCDASGSAAVRAGDVRRYKPMSNHDFVTYEEFGRRFFEVAVTPERVAAAFADIAGSEFAMEPIAQGPGKIAKVSANVSIQEPASPAGWATASPSSSTFRCPSICWWTCGSTSSALWCRATSPCARRRERPNRCC